MDCAASPIVLLPFDGRKVVGDFEGGRPSSNGGAVLLRDAADRIRTIVRLAGCCTDHGSPMRIEHSVAQPPRQRVTAMALGCEDLNDRQTRSRGVGEPFRWESGTATRSPAAHLGDWSRHIPTAGCTTRLTAACPDTHSHPSSEPPVPRISAWFPESTFGSSDGRARLGRRVT